MKRPKNRIVEKLLVMGLVQDKKELRKKRAKKSHGGEGERFCYLHIYRMSSYFSGEVEGERRELCSYVATD